MRSIEGSASRRLPLMAVTGVLIAGAVWVALQGGDQPGEPTRSPGETMGAVQSGPRRPAVPSGEAPEPGFSGPAGVLPPDSSLHGRTDRPTSALVRGEVTLTAEVAFPPAVFIRLVFQGQPEDRPARAFRAQAGPGNRGFRFEEVPFGAWLVVLEAPGFQDFEFHLTVDETHADHHLLLPLVPANHIRGRVITEGGGLVEGVPVTVTLQHDDKTRAIRPRQGITDAKGEFDITGMEPGRYQVHAGRPFQRLSKVKEIQMLGSEAWVELVVPVFGSAVVQVLDFASGKAVEGVQITAQGRGGHTESGKSGRDGKVVFLHLPPGEYSFTAYGENRRRTMVNRAVRADRKSEVEIRVPEFRK